MVILPCAVAPRLAPRACLPALGNPQWHPASAHVSARCQIPAMSHERHFVSESNQAGMNTAQPDAFGRWSGSAGCKQGEAASCRIVDMSFHSLSASGHPIAPNSRT